MNVAHGVELGGDGKPAWLRFGILRLLYHLYVTNSDKTNWITRLHSEDLRHRIGHFQQCFSKFNRAARHVDSCAKKADDALARLGEFPRRGERIPLEDPNRLVIDEVNTDLPVFLDAMLFYLRIQADTFAQLVGYFYESGQILPGDFRHQSRWFTETRPNYDPEFSAILRAHHGWFDRLAGDEGLRDVVTHEGGMFGVGWSRPEGGPIEPRTWLYGSRGMVEENVFVALQEITAGWFTFLDQVWSHFVPRLTRDGVLSTLAVEELEKTRWIDLEDCGSPWVYPICAV
jgi:hypothetical protein